ncbi:recombinase RecT [Streptomyces sp. NPDC016675]|uniref:recombinase RecT n=1 Tax=Streptomyces sp. NPDC016675 TaxID=3364970 RepID=UPI0036F68DC2
MTVTAIATRTPAPAPTAPGGALSLSVMSPYEAWQFCESLANTPLLPDVYRKNPASVLWAMEYGRALGLDVVTTITTIHVIKGKPTQSADLMLGRARSAGHRVRIKSDRERCVVRIQRADDPDDESEVEWTLDDAVTAGLCTLRDGRPWARDDKNRPQPWERFPRAMLRARAIAEAIRIACPEVLHGAIYTPEELGAVVDQEGQPVIVERADAPQMTEATVVQSTPNTPPQQERRDYLAEAVATTDADQLAAILATAEADGAPAEYMTCLAEIRDAHAAEAVGPVRKLHATAQARGAHPDHLARLAAIGANKPGAKQQAEEPTDADPAAEAAYDGPRNGGTPHSLADARDAQYDVPPTERAAVEAENALRLAASRANLPNLDAAFERAYGLPIAEAPAAQLDAFRQQIEAVAGGAQ